MAARPSSTAAAVFLLLAAALLANPLYLHSPPDRGSMVVRADRTTPATGIASVSDRVTAVEDLPPVAGYAARRAIEDESFGVDRTGPPLTLALLGSEWRYLGSQRHTAIYRPRVTVDDGSTTVRLQNVSIRAAEDDLGVTPPDGLDERDHPKELAWLAQQSSAVVVGGEFRGAWEMRLESAVEAGRLTLPNGNDASTFAPLGEDVRFVARDDRFHRTAIETSDDRITLSAVPTNAKTVIDEVGPDIVSVAELPADVRPVVTRAIQADDKSVRVRRDEANASRLGDLRGRLLRHGGSYYVLRLGHVDDFDLTPLARLLLSTLGVLALLIGAGLEWRARAD